MPVLVLILLAAFGCGRPAEAPEHRFLEAGPAAVFTPDAVSRSETVFSWRFATPLDLEPWHKLAEDEDLRIEDGALTGVYRSRNPSLRRDVDFDADDVDTIRLSLVAYEPRAVLFWARAGERFGPERRITLPSAVGAGGGTVERLDFPVGTHPEWSGSIRNLRFVVVPRPGTRFHLHGIEGLRHRVDGELLAAAAQRPWMIELDHDLRRAFLVPTGTGYTRELEVPDRAVLELAYGSLAVGGRDDRPERLEIQTRVADGEPETLFSVPLKGGEWQRTQVDLDEHAGKRLHLRFTATGPPGTAAVIADPRVRSRRRADRRPDVVMISIDTLRADRLSLYGYPRETSPEIDAWARSAGVTFRSAVTSSSWTLASHASIFSGVDALRHGVNYPETRAPSGLLTLAEILRREGYETIAITGGGYLHPRYGLLQGFDRYRYWGSRARSEAELSSHLERALEIWDEPSREPRFLFFHTYEVHTPYRAREPYFSRLGGRPEELPADLLRVRLLAPEPEDGFAIRRQLLWRHANGEETPFETAQAALVSDLYDSGVAYADAWIGRLLDRLAVPGHEPLVILTSDHGESLGEHGLWGHNSLYDDNLLVPLVLSFPERLAGGREIDAQVRMVDVLPTVLELLDLPVPGDLDGISLLPLIEGGRSEPRPAWSVAAWSNHGVSLRLENARKLIVKNVPWPPLAGREEVYDLTRDPGELRTLPAAAELRRRLARRLAEHADGWLLRFTNDGPSAYRLGLAGPADLPFRLKTITELCGDVSWQDERATIEVPPGCTSTLLLEGRARDRLAITAGDEEDVFPLALDPDRARIHILRLDDGRRLETTTAVTAASLSVTWQPPELALDPGIQPADGELRQQLEALGYLE